VRTSRMRERLSPVNPHQALVRPLRHNNRGIAQLPFPVNTFIVGLSEISDWFAPGECVVRNTALVVNVHKSERDLLQHFLVDAGYYVLPTKTSDEALALCRDYKRNIHLLVADADLAGSGWELAERAAALRPGIVILYLSGNSLLSGTSSQLLDPKSRVAGTQAFTTANMLLHVTEALIHKTQQKLQ
jgi:CheY-like chemotaxis protein